MIPLRDDSVTTLRCPLCTKAFTPTGRQQFCSQACRQKAYRRRHHLTLPPVFPLPRARRDITVYECEDCEQRYYAQQWCPDCNRPADVSASVASARTAMPPWPSRT